MTDREDPYERLRHELRGAADRIEAEAHTSSMAQRRRSRRRWAAGVVAVLAIGGSATAAVVTSSTKDLDSDVRPGVSATRTLGPVLSSLQVSRGALAGSPLSNQDGHVVGARTVREGVTIDVAAGTSTLCLASYVKTDTRRPTVCGQSPLSRNRLLLQRSMTGRISWVAAIVPDGVTEATAEASDGRQRPIVVRRNIGLATFSPASRIARVTYKTAAGATRAQSLSSDSSKPSVKRLTRP